MARTNQTYYSTPQLMRELDRQIDTTIRSDGILNQFLGQAGGIIELYLDEFYSSGALSVTPRFATWPEKDNTGDRELEDATIGSSAVTETWKLTFTSTSAYSVSGSISASQGTGATTQDFTSTNSYLTVNSGFWAGTTMSSGDVVYVDVYSTLEQVVVISNLLAAGLLIRGVFSEERPNESEAGRSYYDDGIALLKSMQEHGLDLPGVTARDIDWLPQPYNIDYYGRDKGTYDDSEETTFGADMSKNLGNPY